MKQFLWVASLLVLASAKKSVLETGFETFGSKNGTDIDIHFLEKNPLSKVVGKTMDKNEDGKVTLEEFEKIAKVALDAIFKTFDLDSDGSVSPKEILSGGYQIDGFIGIINLVFKVADVNRDGFISTADYMKLDETDPPSKLLSTISLLDCNMDGRISLQENQIIHKFGEGQLPELP